jgi:hypothetical protein
LSLSQKGFLAVPPPKRLWMPPTFGSYVGNTTITPTLPAVTVESLFVCILSATSGTQPTMVSTTGDTWNTWASQAHPSGSQSIAAFWALIPPGKTPGVTLTGASGLRSFWRYPNARIDTLQFSFGTTTTLDWTAQPTIASGALLGLYVRMTTAQTSAAAGLASAIAAASLTNRTPTSTTAWAGDSGDTNVVAFDPTSGTLDTAPNRVSAAVFTVKEAE